MPKIIKGPWMKLEVPLKRKARTKPVAKAAGTKTVYQLKISLKGSKPAIWRRVWVDNATTLDVLHTIIQIAMGWDDCHLHFFEANGLVYSSPDPEMMIDDAEDETSVTLKKLAPDVKARFKYEYDMGDGWLHDIVVEKCVEPEAGKKLPCCLAGEGACPPEDCGGLWGYYSMLEVCANPKHEEFKEMSERLPEDFDPAIFNLDEVNKILAKHVK